MELMGKSVYDWLRGSDINEGKKKKKEPFKKRMKVAKQCALGMNFLHCSTPPILHLDLKTQNILINDHDTVKVAGKLNRYSFTIVILTTDLY